MSHTLHFLIGITCNQSLIRTKIKRCIQNHHWDRSEVYFLSLLTCWTHAGLTLLPNKNSGQSFLSAGWYSCLLLSNGRKGKANLALHEVYNRPWTIMTGSSVADFCPLLTHVLKRERPSRSTSATGMSPLWRLPLQPPLCSPPIARCMEKREVNLASLKTHPW